MNGVAPSDLDASLDRVERESAGTAARILRCAEQLFAARGFDGVTTRDVAAAAGVNISTLHFHWASKRTLYEAVCRFQARQLLASFGPSDPASARRATTPADRIERDVDHWIDLLIGNPAIARLAWQSASGQSDPDLPTLLRHDVALFRRLQSEVREALPPGRKDDAILCVLLLFYFAIGIFSDSPLQRAVLDASVHESPELQQRVKDFARRLTGGLLRDEASKGGRQ